MPELTKTYPYVDSRVDYNTPMPESPLTLWQSQLYPPVRDLGFGLSWPGPRCLRASFSESRKYPYSGLCAESRRMTVNTATVAGNSSGGRTRTCPSPSFDARSLKAGNKFRGNRITRLYLMLDPLWGLRTYD